MSYSFCKLATLSILTFFSYAGTLCADDEIQFADPSNLVIEKRHRHHEDSSSSSEDSFPQKRLETWPETNFLIRLIFL
jgi:hypothetical protein